MKNNFHYLLIISIFFSCGNQERISREVFDEVNKSMEVKKVNEAEMIQEAMKWGEEIATEAQQQLIATLQEAISEKGVAEAVAFCNSEAMPVIQQVEEKHHVTVRRVTYDYRNPNDKPDEVEDPLLDMYQYNSENDFTNENNIQKINNGDVLLFTKAIKIPSALCLNCHGEPGKDIDDTTLNRINELYPEDKATGHKVGDLRGMWSIRIPKKEVIKRM